MTKPQGAKLDQPSNASASASDLRHGESPADTGRAREVERTRIHALLEVARQNVKRIEDRELAGEQVGSDLLNFPLR